MYQISQKIPENTVTIRIAITRFFSSFVSGALSFSLSAFSTFSERLSTRNGFFPASPKDFIPTNHHTQSINRKIPQTRNIVRYPAFVPISERNVVPQNDPMLTNMYCKLNTVSSSSWSANGKRRPLIPDTFPLKKPVPIETRIIIAHIIAIPLASVALQAHR